MKRSRVGWALGLAALALEACGGAATDHERLGDRAYADRHFADAVVEYRLALKRAPTPALHAKAALAALHAGDLVTAAGEYRALAEQGGASRRVEAADGLERVARAAVEADDRAGLAAALAALHAVAEGRALGTFARQLAQSLGSEPRGTEALAILPYAAVGTPDARQQDSVMLLYGLALQRAGRCEQAIAVFEGLARRQRDAQAVAPAVAGIAACALTLGQRALEAGEPQRAEEWFRRAAAGADERDPVGRAAYLGLGEVLFARGALAEAAEAYQRVLAGGQPGDSLVALAAEKLNQIANAGVVVR